MFLVLLYIFILKLDPSISHFQPHTDFQKVGDAVFNNEKYNILKITTHSISDYFENFVLRNKNNEFPSKRLFIDDNGFRHFWSGFEKKSKSLRKTEIITDIVDSTQDNIQGEENLPAVVTKNFNNEKNNSNESDIDTSNKNYNSSENENLGSNQNSLESTTTEGDDIEVVTKKSYNVVKEISNSSKLQLRKGKTKTTPKPNQNLKERNVIQTTFYCPFFGVITLSAFADPE